MWTDSVSRSTIARWIPSRRQKARSPPTSNGNVEHGDCHKKDWPWMRTSTAPSSRRSSAASGIRLCTPSADWRTGSICRVTPSCRRQSSPHEFGDAVARDFQPRGYAGAYHHGRHPARDRPPLKRPLHRFRASPLPYPRHVSKNLLKSYRI